ncbi:MAG: Ldh family oxidoreductase [Gammaproteobacteria bacterium]|nr:MAG: Ldh family oxidoreductase [Gammaproteobacteria bacterium]
MPSPENIDVSSLTQLSDDAFRHAGLSVENAGISTRILVDAEMMGLSPHGVIRIPEYANRLLRGGVDPNAAIRVDKRAPTLAIVDGNNALGTVVGSEALDAALEMVAETGLAYVGCRNSNHFGALAPYGLRACDAGYVLIAGTNASTTMAPWGGREIRIGNNPLCIAAPCADGVHFILDMATSVAARGKIRAAQKAGSPIPQGWAADRSGIPTTDASEALAGSLLPFGGHKGSGLSMAVDILSGALTGAEFLTDVSSWSENPDAPSGVGHFFVLVDPDRLLGPGAFASAMDRFKSIVLSTPSANATIPVVLPGQREQERRRAAMEDGITVPGDLLASIRALAVGQVGA